MLDLLLSVVVVFVFAWIARALVGARELTWGRTILAVLIGIGLGDTAAILLVTRDLGEIPAIGPEFYVIGMPFRLVATMGAIVVLEVLFSRSRRRRGLTMPRPFRALRRFIGVGARAWEVSRIAARHGLGPLIGQGRTISQYSPEDLARRTRLALEECGGMFIKLGQLLATRPDLLPPEATRELGRLHSSAVPLAPEEVQAVVEDELGRPLAQVFGDFDWDPLGSASIGQAHSATLHDGSPVVVKVRRPGLVDQVERDLTITMWMARNAERRTDWGEAYGVEGLAGEFADALRSELDFRVEARQVSEMVEAVVNDPGVRVPAVVDSLTTEGLMVMERLQGSPLSGVSALPDTEAARELADALCESQVRAMLEGRRFHGDPHPGNIMLLDDDSIGLIDMGITGRLDRFEQAAVFQMLVALKLEQPTLLYESMVSIGAVRPGHDPDEIERALAQFMASYLGPQLPPPQALTDLLRLIMELGLRLPRSATTMFRALATLTGTLEHLSPGYPLVEVVADLGGAQLQRRFMPDSASEFIQ
ncbi:MAG: AarF/ABC1/UbiB kinase family protein, partial [Acidimicrobiia bacterium]|nr:AarF/ABC1/UbiB kinase family protein [Acidimicrobiia bacterium]